MPVVDFSGEDRIVTLVIKAVVIASDMTNMVGSNLFISVPISMLRSVGAVLYDRCFEAGLIKVSDRGELAISWIVICSVYRMMNRCGIGVVHRGFFVVDDFRECMWVSPVIAVVLQFRVMSVSPMLESTGMV